MKKIGPLAKLAEWIASHYVKTVGIITMFLSAMLTAPSSIAFAAAVAGSVAVYILAAPTSFWEYGGLALAVCWFARTRSTKIRSAIVVFFTALYLYGHWGTQLLTST